MQEAGTSYDIRSLNYETLFLMLGVSLFLLLVPVVKLRRRTGHHAAWSLLSIVPGLKLEKKLLTATSHLPARLCASSTCSNVTREPFPAPAFASIVPSDSKHSRTSRSATIEPR